MSKKNYDHYTSQGANLQQAHTEYAEWHESNHHSFFNMNNAMGLFKIIIIAGIILIVVIALSPLFKFLTSLLGAGQAGLHFLTDLLKMCETIGVCNLTAAGQAALNSVPPGSLKPGMAFAGTCDDNSPAANKGGRCQKVEEPISDTSPPPPPCGSRTSSLCFWGLLGWIFMAPIMALLGGLWGLLGCKGFSKKLPGNWCTDEEVSKAKGEESKVEAESKGIVDEATRDADPIEPDNDAKNKEGEAIDSAGKKYYDGLPDALPKPPKYPQEEPSPAMKDFYDPPKNQGDPWTLKDNKPENAKTWDGGTPKEGEAKWTDFQKAFVKACGGKPIAQEGDGHGYTWSKDGNEAFMEQGNITDFITNTRARATSQNMMGKSVQASIDLQIDQNNELIKQLAKADEARKAELNSEIKANAEVIKTQQDAEAKRQEKEAEENDRRAGEDADSFPRPEEGGP